MTWEEKFQALQALGDTVIRMRYPGDWYTHTTGLEEGGDGFLRGVGGNGPTPQKAVENQWERCIAVQVPKYLVVNAYRDNRRQVRWNGFMWADVAMEVKA